MTGSISTFRDREDFLRMYVDLMLLLDAVDFRSEVVVFADLEDESGRNFSSAFSYLEYVISEDGKAWAAAIDREFLANFLRVAWPAAKATIAGLMGEYFSDERELVLVISAGGCQLRGTTVAGVER